MSYPWFRMWNSVLADPKVQMLDPVRFKQWVNLLAVANQGKPRGTLPPVGQMAFSLRCSEEEAVAIIEYFRSLDLVDARPDGSLTPHNWAKWQPEGDGQSTERVRAWRDRKRNGSETLHETDVKRFSNVSRNGRETWSPNSVSSLRTTQESSSVREEETDVKRFSNVSRNVSSPCPDYPDPETSFIVPHPGPHEIPDVQARSIWRRLWATWGDAKILHGWYEHHRWYSADTWLAAFAQVKKQYSEKAVGIRLIEKLAADIDAHGIPEAKPFAPEDRGAATPKGGRPKTEKQQWRDDVSEHLKRLKEKNRSAEAAEGGES